MIASSLNYDIFIGVKTDDTLTIIPVKSIDIQYILLGLLGYCLDLVNRMLDKPIEFLAWLSVANEWIKVYAIELAEAMLCKLLKARWG